MRTLSIIEIDSITGAGTASDLGLEIGNVLGQAGDTIYSLIENKNPSISFSKATGLIGEGIGGIIDGIHTNSGFLDAIGNINSGLSSIFHIITNDFNVTA